MDADAYFWKTKKRPPKTKARAKPLPKAKDAYLEAEETLFQELEEHLIGYERKFQFEPTKNWRFDFYIVKLRLLIEIAGSPWSVGRGGKKIANALCKYYFAIHQSNELRRQSGQQIWQQATGLNLYASDQYNDHLRTRKSSLNWWKHAIQTGITRGFGFNATTWLKLIEHLRYQQTKLPKSGMWIPAPEPVKPPYVGTGDLHFCCKYTNVDPLNVVLNFSDDPCCSEDTEPLDNKKVYFIMNEGHLKRVSDNSAIEVKSLNLSIDRDSWCWSFSASLPFTEESKVNTDDEYIEVELGLNGFIWRFLIESNTSNQQFASTDIQVKGRSLIAMLAEEAGTRSYNQAISASSVQLAQAELECITLATPFTLDWSLVDQTGWNVRPMPGHI